MDALVDLREHDVPYHIRVQIDCDVRCGHWFTVRAKVRIYLCHYKGMSHASLQFPVIHPARIVPAPLHIMKSQLQNIKQQSEIHTGTGHC